MDLTWSEPRTAFRAECRAWLEANVPDRRRCRRATPPRGSPCTSSGSALLHDARYAVVSWPEAYGGRDAIALGVADLRGGVLPGRWRPSGSPRTASSCSPRPSSSSAPPAQQDYVPAPDVGRRGPVVPGLVRAQRRLRPGGHHQPGRPRRRAPVAGVLTGQKTWTTRGAFCTHLFGLFRTDPEAERHRGLTYFLVPLDADGHDRAGLRSPRRRRGLRRGVPRRRVRARRRRPSTMAAAASSARSTRGGAWRWRPPSSERGLTLRSPGRFQATADRLRRPGPSSAGRRRPHRR